MNWENNIFLLLNNFNLYVLPREAYAMFHRAHLYETLRRNTYNIYTLWQRSVLKTKLIQGYK